MRFQCSRRMIPVFLAALFTVQVLYAQADALKEFRRAFRPAKDAAAVQDRRAKALKALAGGDSAEVAEAMLNAYRQLEKEINPIEEMRLDFLLGKRNDNDLKKRTQLDPLRNLQDDIRDALAGMKAPPAVDRLVQRALSDRKLGLTLRIALAEKAGGLGESACANVQPLLKRSRDPGSLLVGLSASRSLGKAARSLGERIIPYLDHEEPAVRESAASALAALCLPESIMPLIDRLEQENGRTKTRVALALQFLTRQNFGTSAHAWRRWLDPDGKPFLTGEVVLGGGVMVSKDSAAPRYHQIPMDGESILYVFDYSKSMRHTMTKPSHIAKDGEESRYTRARDELLRSLQNLSPVKTFNIIAFARRCERYSPEMVKATPDNIKAAQDWVRGLELELGTVLYDALDLAFSTAGRGVLDRYYDSTVDTIFVLTDGHPIVAGKRDSNSRIRNAVRHWNLLGRVVIHVIGLGDNVPKKWLTSLAKENGGKFVHEESREKE